MVPPSFVMVLDGPRRHRLEAGRVALCQRTDAGMAEGEEPGFREALICDGLQRRT